MTVQLIEHSHWNEVVRTPSASAPEPRPRVAARARVSSDAPGQLLQGLLGGAVAGALLESEMTWRDAGLDARTLERMPPARVLALLADLSPEVSRALWDFSRLLNPGWKATAALPSGAAAGRGRHQAALDALLARLSARHGALDLVIGRLLTGGLLRGTFVAELVLDEAARQALALVTPDPATIEWRQTVRDAAVGPEWIPGQRQRGQFIALDRPTIRVVPIDPLPGLPGGRAPFAPALFAATFLMALLHDLRRVVQQQGYPRLDLAIKLDALRSSMPPQAAQDPTVFKAWVDGTITEVQRFYEALEPDDAFVHTDAVTVNRPVGTVDSSSLGAVDGLIEALVQALIRALKTIPILMGVTDGVSEANVRVQWRLFRATLRTLQHSVEQVLSQLLQLALEAEGIAATVTWKFAEVDLTDRMIDAQTEGMQIANAITAYQAGFISQDEAALMAVGRERADAPGPRRAPAPVPQEPDPGDEPEELEGDEE
jgi:hypothetical protein